MNGTQTFTMNASKEAFQILSSSLYSNPKLAIIRELSTNAFDSHKQAGKEDYPFNLHLPTPEEPFFDIRDYGDGIPENLIYDIYTSYFVSTKTDDENQTGCFGLGSKTPFSLVDNYKVISYCEGKKKTYKMFKEEGLPCVKKIAEEDWTKDTGLEIHFDWLADREWKYEEWSSEAKKFFRATRFLPNVNTFISDPNFNWEDFMKSREFNSFESVDFGGCYYCDISVNVAGVGFLVDFEDLKSKGSELKDLLNKAYIRRINIMANKSDVTLTPSREVLHYDEKTINFVYNNVKRVVEEYYQKINNNFDNYNYRDALNISRGQTYDLDLSNKFKTKISDTFFKYSLGVSSTGRGKTISTINPINDSIGSEIKLYLVDFNGIKSTVKQNVVDNFLSGQAFDDRKKLTSASFADVVKRISKDDYYRVLFPKDYKDAENLKACKEFLGEGVEIVDWATLCNYKKTPSSSGRKSGFKTMQTINCDNSGKLSYGYTNSPDLQDGETGIIVKEEQLGGSSNHIINYSYVVNKLQILIDLEIPFKLAVRPCKDSVFEKYKEKGFLTLEEYIKAAVNANIDKAKEKILDSKKFFFLRKNVSYSYHPELEEVFNNPAYDSLMEVEDFKTLRELYKEETYAVNGYSSLRNLVGIDNIPDFKTSLFEDFPLFDKIAFDGPESWKNFLDYMLLYKDSQFFQVEKKIAKESA